MSDAGDARRGTRAGGPGGGASAGGARWRVPLPRGAEPPYRVFVNGVPQQEGRDYELVGHELRFVKPLEKERIGVGRWTAMFLGLFGSYGKNDSVDVQYRVHGVETVATGLDIVPPDKP